MSQAYSRKLDEPRLAEHFLKTALEIKPGKKEINLLSNVEKELSNKDIWTTPFINTDKRWELRRNIAKELFSKTRLADDDKISLGAGGSKPKGKVKNERQAYIVIGLPAAGKSGISNKIADLKGAYVLDNDYAKRKIPEFKKSKIGASITHAESDAIVFGRNQYDDFKRFTPLIFQCVQNGTNVVIPKIGAKSKSILELVDSLTDICNYTVHLVLVNLDRKDSTKRAFARFIKSKRYVPLSLVFDGYANDPTLTYFRLKESKTKIATFGEIDTTERKHIKRGDTKSIIYSIN